jgi:hypothetical protein
MMAAYMSTAERDFMQQAAEIGPATLMPTMEAQYVASRNAMELWSNSNFRGNAAHEVLKGWQAEREAVTGRPLKFKDLELQLLSTGEAPMSPLDRFNEAIVADGGQAVTEAELWKAADAKALAARSTQAAMERQREAAGGSSAGWWASTAGSVVGGAKDPLNILMMQFGAAASAGIAATAAIEGGLAAAGQAFNEATLFGERARIAAEGGAPAYTTEEAVGNVAGAFAGGAVVGGGVKAFVVGVKKLLARGEHVPQTQIDAARVLEANELLNAGAPPNATHAQFDQHIAAYIKASEQAAGNRPIDVEGLFVATPRPPPDAPTGAAVDAAVAAKLAEGKTVAPVADAGTLEAQALIKEAQKALPAAEKPESLLQFIARNGGLRDDGGELAFMGLDKVGFRRGGNGKKEMVIRRDGLSYDEMRAKAEEAGFIVPADRTETFGRTEESDLLAAVETEAKGKPVYRIDDRAKIAEAERARAQFDEQKTMLESAGKDVHDALVRMMGGEQHVTKVPDAVRTLAVRDMARGVDAETAVDNALERWALSETYGKDVAPDTSPIPFAEEAQLRAMAKEDAPPPEVGQAVEQEANRAALEQVLNGENVKVLVEDADGVMKEMTVADAITAHDEEIAQLAKLMVCVVGEVAGEA